jgi:hypothetical protein
VPAPLKPEPRNLHRKAQALVEQAAAQQAESSTSRINHQGSTQNDGDARGPEASIRTGGAMERPANQGQTPVKERILDTRGWAEDGDARNVINARQTSNAEARAAAGYHPRQGGCYDSCEDRSPTPDSGNPCVQPGGPHGELSSTLPLAHIDRQVHRGDGPPCMAQRLSPSVPAGRSHHRRGHHPQPAVAPRRLGTNVARAPAGQPDS